MSERVQALVIVGAGGHAREVHQLVLDINAVRPAWQVIGFAVESPYTDTPSVHGLPVHDIDALAASHPEAHVVVAVGSPALRRRLAETIAARRGSRFATLVHPRASVGSGVEMGEGCVVFSGGILTTDIRLGRHVHVNVAASISHDGRVGDFVTLAPHACCCGGVVLGDEVDVGAGAVVLPRVEVGARSVVGAGSVVTKHLPADATAAGVPAKVMS